MTANWFEGLFEMARNLLRVAGKSETENTEQALANVRVELAGARAQCTAEEATLARLTAEALDVDVGAGVIQSQHVAIGRAEQKVRQLEGLERALVERLARAKSNEAAKEFARLAAADAKEVGEIDEGMRMVLTAASMLTKGTNKIRAASARRRQFAFADSARVPQIWDKPRILCAEVLIELERGDPVTFVSRGSGVHVIATLEAKHNAALSEALPPSPEPTAGTAA